MTVFGAHLLTPLDGGAVSSANRAKVHAVKTMAPDVAPIAGLLERDPNGLVIVRHFFELSEQAEYRRLGPAGATAMTARIADTFGDIIDYCAERGRAVYAEALNEPDPNPWNDLPALNDFTVAFAVAARNAGLRPLAYSWGTGNPPSYGWAPATPQFADYPASLKAMWAVLLPGLRACVDAGGGAAFHSYDWPDWLTDPYWQGLRFLNDLDAIAANDPELAARCRVYVTEASIDVGIKPEYVEQFGERKGWRTSLKGDGAEFARQAGAYLTAIRRSRWAGNIVAVFPFTGGTGGGWADYSTDDIPEYEALVAADVPQGETMTHKETIVTIDPLPAVHPGDSIHVTGLITGVDGPKGKAQVYARYPQRDASTDWGQTGYTLVDVTDGPFAIDVTLGQGNYPFDAPLTGVLDFKVLELDPSNQSFEMPSFAVPLTILPVAQAQTPPTGQPATIPPAGLSAREAARETVFAASGDGYNADSNPIWLDIQAAVDAMKSGKTDFSKPPKK